MTLQWLVAGASLLAALVAWRYALRTARKLEQLSHLYWELRYQHGELRVQVQQMSGASAPPPASPPSSPERSGDVFVPLASLKR